MAHHCEECGDKIEKGVTRHFIVGDAHLCSTECKKAHNAFLREQADEMDAYDDDTPRARRPAYIA